jgi:TonB family protein
MQPRRHHDFSLSIALCASLALHGLSLLAIVLWYVRATSAPKLAALPRPAPPAPIILPPEPPPAPPPPPPKPGPPPKADFKDATKAPPRDDSGEAVGKGTANRTTPGDRPMEAPRGREQANLTRDAHEPSVSKLDESSPIPAQSGADIGSDPLASIMPTPPTPPPVPAPAPPGKPPVAADAVVLAARIPEIAVGAAESLADAMKQLPPPPVETPALPTPPTPPAPPTPLMPPVQPTNPPQKIDGHSSLPSDTDSPPFAKANSVRFHNGQLLGRQGRKVKTTRIQFGLAAMSDFMSLPNPTVVLGVTVDAGGNVKNVEILQSSGSSNIDQPCKVAVYNWWFEPEKDKNGHPLPDLWVVTID